MELRAQRRTVELDSGPLAMSYVDVGGPAEPRAVVLAHGLGGRWQHWTHVIPALSGHRVLAVDLPGFGESSLPARRPFDLGTIADAVARLLQSVGVEQVTFVGHSFGGPLALTFAGAHPQMVERLVLVAGTVQSFQRTLAGGIRPWVTRPATAAATVAELAYTALPLPRPLRAPLARTQLGRWLALWPFVRDPGRLDPADARLLIDGAGAPGVLPTARAIARAAGWERLPVGVPVVLINGDADLIAPLADLRSFAGRVDEALVVKRAGHLPMIERPEAFNRVLAHALTVTAS